MLAKLWSSVLMLSLCVVPAHGQESVRDLRGPGQFGAFLTHNQIDRWVFDGEKGETIIAHVVSKEFDPILELARTGAKDDDKVLLEVDDPGNESRYAIRLPEKGQYKIRVHAYKFQGGGNYTLTVQRFRATPLAIGTPLVGTFDRTGRSCHYFPVAAGQILVPELRGSAAESWQMLDFKGRVQQDWAGAVTLEEGGESYLILTGPPNSRYDLVVREARQRNVDEGKPAAVDLKSGELDVWSFQGKPGDFRLLEIEKKGELLPRLLYAPLDRKSEQRLASSDERPELALLPVMGRGGRLRFAAVLGREGRYQMQLLARSPTSYKLTVSDPSVPIAWSKEAIGELPVGGAAFYSFKATPGQLLEARLASPKFVPMLRLYDGHGSLIGESGERGDALDGRIAHMVVHEGLYRLQVSSLGDGGGGEFRQSLSETKIKELAIGERGQGTVQPGATDFWAFFGQEGKTVFLNVRSTTFQPTVSLRNPDGVQLATDNRGNTATGNLLAVKLPKTGRYTVWISSQRGAGDFTVRLIDGD